MTPTGRSRMLPNNSGRSRTAPAALHAALDARRREQTPPAPWWRIAAELDTDLCALRRMRDGHLSPALRERVEEWLRRRPAPPRTE